MKVDRIELFQLCIPLKQPFETSFGRTGQRDIVLARVTAEGLSGWGEAATSHAPLYSYETVKTCLHILEEFLAPILLKSRVVAASEVSELLALVRGHPMAKTALEEAFWDLLGRASRKSVAELLGGVRERIYPGVSVGIQERVEDLLELIEGYRARRYSRIKVKIKPGWDVAVIREIRRRFPELPLMVDANGAYRLEHRAIFRELDNFNLMMVEQPLAYWDLLEHASLQRELATPICLDESINNPHDLACALTLGSCRVVNIKPGRVGGLAAAKEIHDMAEKNGVPVWCGGMLESGVGRAHNVALSSLPNFTLPGDVSESERYFDQDIVEPPFRLEADGGMAVPRGPGIGVEVDEESVARYTVRTVVIK